MLKTTTFTFKQITIMTAEQALIEENKRDPRVRYITYSKSCKVFTFWAKRPIMTDIKGDFYHNSYISHIENVDLLDTESFILCIDDIKPEVPPIPEKWYIEFDKDNFEILNSWRLKKATHYLKDDNLTGCFLLSNDFFKDGSFYVTIGQSIPENYQKITLEQFKKYVLGIEEKQDKTQEPNDFKLSSTPYVSGRIVSVDMDGNQFKTTNDNSTFEFYSTRCWIEDRINYINQFIKRNIDSDLCVNPEWISERNELIEKLKNL